MDEELAPAGGALDDEDEELMPGRRALFGIKFHDEESQQTARRVAIASATLGVLVILHFLIHVARGGRARQGLPHMLLGLALPWIGYRGATLEASARWKPRLLWAFHLGNVFFVIIHSLVLLFFVLEVLELESASVERMCDLHRSNDPLLPPAGSHRGPEAMPTLPPLRTSLKDCIASVEAEKAHAPGLLWLWIFISLPYWACAAYAAYYSHELYLQLRIRELTIHRGSAPGDADADRGVATVGWRETAVE
mmetsp:Transcript_56434/g.158304  ORF Transcript_56434/g.158304 Transcript_56434/m.158304 type:complete len:251 (-) Transcript_56434:173-925(-)